MHDESRQEKLGLTPRELEIVTALVAGYTNKEISENLKLSLSTIKLYLFRIFEKLNVNTRLQLVLLWLNGPQDRDEAGIAVKKPRGPNLNRGSAAASLED
jgi:DNA-binding CsgD family transcriptional regulator